MTANVGNMDRIVRGVAGVVLILLPFLTGFGAGGTLLTWGAVVVGAILALTAVFRMCPIYRILGLNTCKL